MSKASLATCLVMSLFLTAASKAQNPSFHNAPLSSKQQKNSYESQHPASAKADCVLRCAACHGLNGEGTGNIPPLTTGKAQAASDSELFWYITKGEVNNGMPSWESPSEEQRWQTRHYLRVLGSLEPGSSRVPLPPTKP